MAHAGATVNESLSIDAFRRRFAHVTPTATITAPGRVNLIGDHVDYCDGLVLPIAIEASVRVVVGRLSEPFLRVYSQPFKESFECGLDELDRRVDGWFAYILGIAAALRDRGVRLNGTAIHVESDIPIGAGLSSSAALCAGVGLALLHAAGHSMPIGELAGLCREAENIGADVPCGIMDPLVCLAARRGFALLIDCRDHEFRHVPWPDGELVAMIIDSRVHRELSSGHYSRRVHECGEASRIISGTERGVSCLRDATLAMLESHRAGMDPTWYRRARHVVSEIERVDRACAALEANDLALFGRLMNESHASLRDDYECCPPRIDDLAKIVRRCPGVHGARMTGGGFGGCVVALARNWARAGVESALKSEYDAKYGVSARPWCCRPCDGAAVRMLE